VNTLWLEEILDERAVEDIVAAAAAALMEAPKAERKGLVAKFTQDICRAIRQDLRTRVRGKLLQEYTNSLNRIKRTVDIEIEREREEVI